MSTFNISVETYEHLEQRATREGCSVDDFLNRLLDDTTVEQTPFSLSQKLVEYTSHGIALFDLDFRYLYVNPALEHIIGCSAAEMIGKTDQELGLPLHLTRDWDEARQVVVDSRQEQIVIFDLTTSQGLRFYETRITAGLRAAGCVQNLVAITRDITERKQAEEALRHSETNFRTLFNTINDFLFVLDAQGSIQEVNQTVLQRLGYSKEELLGQSVLMVHPPERRAEAGQIVVEMLQGKRDACPVPVQTKSGDLIPVETYITRGLWNGQPALFGVTKDLSALKFSEEKFSKAFHANPAIAGLSDIKTGKYIEVNQAFYDILGFTPEEVIGKSSTDILKLDNQFRQRVIEKLKQQGCIRGEEGVIYAKDGTAISVLLFADIIQLQNAAYNFTIAVDITERKHTEEALRESEARLKMTLQGTRAGTWEWNIPTGEVVVNQRWAEIVGYTLDELSPISIQTWIDLAHPDDLETSNQLLEKHFSGKSGHYACEARMKHKDGHWIWVWDRGMVMEWDENGKPLRMFGTHIDITEHKQAQQREFELALEKERANLLRQFIEKASHEFRTPLSTINASAYLMGHIADAEKRQVKAATIETQVIRITRLVDMLLMMTKLEKGIDTARFPVEIPRIFELVCKTMINQYGDHLKIYCQLQPDLPPIMGNIEYLQDGLEQILDNAYRFTPPNGSITLSASLHENCIWMEIQDTGAGIRKADLPHIFEMFWRQDDAHTSPGFGLGLPIAQKIIEMHHGTIEVESEVGVGTTFRIVLPLSTPDQPHYGSSIRIMNTVFNS